MSGDFCPGSSILISNMGQKVATTLIDRCQSTMAGGATAWFHAWVPLSEPTEPYQIYMFSYEIVVCNVSSPHTV